MKRSIQIIFSTILIFSFYVSALPCGPAFVTPLFDYKSAPENPYINFAAGRIGILKPTYHRSVLFAAYRYLNGGTFTAAEQKALVDVWNADFNNKNYIDDDVSEAVKLWVEARKTVVGKEEKPPQIYAERAYGGYDFFPNCTESAFEVATETLKSRSLSYGSDDKDVRDWLAAQDKVFSNCSEGRQSIDEANSAMPEWLQKDRAYQMAAASLYSMDYADAKKRFAEIAQDFQSPWQETADYLVGRTIIRQASLSKSEDTANRFYAEAEEVLYRLASSGNKYNASADRLLGMVKFRLHPEQRVRELAQSLSYQSGGENFRQELIDYTWLLDKFEKEALETEEKRIEEEKQRNSDVNVKPTPAIPGIPDEETLRRQMNMPGNAAALSTPDPANEGKTIIYLQGEDNQGPWQPFIDPNGTDEEAFADVQKQIGMPLTDKMKEQVREARKSAYANQFSGSRSNDYPGRYYGEVPASLSLLPRDVRADDLTDWLYTYQLKDGESYLYSLNRYKQVNSDLWLATAISKADKASTELNRLFEAADKLPQTSLAYPTVAFNKARLLIDLNKTDEARKLLDSVLNSTIDMPVSSRNQFLELRFKLSQTLEEFLTFAQRKPFAFDLESDGKSIDEIIAERKTWYNPEYDKVSKADYDEGVEKEYAVYKLWENRTMFDDRTMQIVNQHFPLEMLLQAANSKALPEYLQDFFFKAAFVRSLLLKDYATAEKLAPEILKIQSDLKPELDEFLAAKPAEKERAALFLILKHEELTPYVPSGFGETHEQIAYASRWWCAPYEEMYDEATGQSVPRSAISKPSFLTAAQSKAAETEMAKLKEVGDAPKFLGEKVLGWQKLYPKDRRVPESLFIVYESNDWDKYGCGGVQELRKAAADTLRAKYPNSDFTKQTVEQTEQ